MQIKTRLQINIVVSLLMAFVICLVLFLSLNNLNRENNSAKIVGDIISSALERVTLRNDYVRNNSERAKEQWFAKHEQINVLLKSAVENFRDAVARKNIGRMIDNQGSIGKIFSDIVTNREKTDLKPDSAVLSREVEGRLISQLNMRVYEEVVNSRKLLESSRKTREAALRLAGGGVIFALVLFITAVIISSLSMQRAITARVARLREGAAVIGSGDLDYRIDIKGDDEFAELSESFNAMTAKLSGSYHDLEIEVYERKQTEEALRQSEERYRTLFNTLIDGFCIIEVIFDSAGRPVDYRFLEINPAFEEQTGLQNVQGRFMREIAPDNEESWFEIYGKIALTGEPARFVKEAGALKRWFDVSAYRVGRPENRQVAIVFNDITVRKHAEEALRASHDALEARVRERTEELATANEIVDLERKRLYGVLETLPVYVILLTSDYHVSFANRFFRERFGDAEGKCCYEYLFNRSEPCEICETYTVLKTNLPHHWYWTGPDGRNYDIYDYCFVDADGSRLILEMGIDITDQKQAQNALREINDTLEKRILERTAQLSSVNKTLRSSRVAALNLMEDAVNARREAEEVSERLLLEIAERKRAEEALRASEEHLRTLLVNIPGAAYRCEINAPWRMSFMSEGVEAITGHPASVFLVQDCVLWGDLVLPEDLPEVERVVALGVANKAPYEMEYRIRHADGGIRWVFEQGRAVHDSEGRPLCLDGVIVNITARKQVEMELLKAKEAAEAATRIKSQFLANMSHELRTPMTGVLGMLEITLDNSLEQEQRETIEMAHRSAGSLLRIINDILDLTKVEAGKLSMENAPFSLRECISGPIDILISEARRKGLDLAWSLADNMPETVIGDQMRLRQVLTNLLGNAVKFTEKGKVELKVTPGGKTADGRLNVCFTVTDSGIGIAGDKIDIIFQPFSQADISNTRRYGGTGLGLAISLEIVRLMGGTIDCKSEEGLGSTFTFSVPLGATATASETEASPGLALQQQSIYRIADSEARPRLLVAEDDPIIQQLLGRIFKKANYDHDFAADGVTTVEKWEKGCFDLILMDVQMPLMDGFKATAAIREKERVMGGHTTIIAMTAHTLKEDEERCITAGMDAYISKPVDVRKCLELIGDFINKGKKS